MSFETEPNADAIDFLFEDTRTLDERLRAVDSYTAGILERALERRRPTVEESAHLLALRDVDLSALIATADEIRREDVGDVVTYVGTPGPGRSSPEGHAIRRSAAETLDRLYSARVSEADARYQYGRIAVVGHSLGSVIAYDALNRVIGNDVATGERSRVIDRTALLLTFGSPLDKIAFIFGYDKDDLKELLQASETPLIVDYGHRRFPWVNVHAPADIVSGALDLYDLPDRDPLDPRRVRNEADPLALTPLAAHNEYWHNPVVWERVRDAVTGGTPPGPVVEIRERPAQVAAPGRLTGAPRCLTLPPDHLPKR
jgi:hypothetical protein